jgi:hypothetical protein
MPIGLADNESAVAGVDPTAGVYRFLKCIEDPDNPAVGILQVFSGGVPELNPDTGAMAVEMEGSYTDHELEVADVSGGSPWTAFSIASDGRTVAIKRVVAQFQTAHVNNVFRVTVDRTVGNSTRTFTLYELSDTTKKNFFIEGHTLIRPDETVKVVYAGEATMDLWACITVMDV